MIEQARFGRTGHLSSRTIFGAAALSPGTGRASSASASTRSSDANTWYEPLTEQADIDLAARFVLGREGLFPNTASDIGLLARALDAASRGGARPTDVEVEALLERRGMTPLFA